MEPIRLTSYSHGAGCACKLASVELAEILSPLAGHPATHHPDLVVGVSTSDDSGVFLLGDGRALVQSVDFFTPIVDDPRDWGRIAAANALSDLYAMGATPVTALQLIGWPREGIPFEVATTVIRGGADTMARAGAVIVGGHSIDDAEPTYGFAVSGIAEASSVVTNAGGRPGDRLVLTKPLGAGVVTTAHKAGACPLSVLEATIEVMASLNDVAGAALAENGATAATDVTGFGLLGHLTEMVEASNTGAAIDVESVPLIAGVRELHQASFYPGGSRRNLDAALGRLDGRKDAADLLADAQTSGGLLVALPPAQVGGYIAAVPGSVEVGELTDDVGRILLR